MPALLLLRHEEANPADDEGDALRALTPRGRRRMHAQARALFDQLPGLDLVLASPLVRATQTAEILVSAFDLDTPVLASRVVSEPASVEHLARRIRDVHAPIGVVAVVGHEPTMSGLLEHLIGGASLGFRTGQAVLLEAGEDRFVPRGAWHGGAPVPL